MKRKNITNWLLVATLTSILTACGGSGSNSSNIIDNSTNEENANEANNTIVDTQAPTVLSVSPSDLETEVALDVNVSLLFDEKMLASSLNNASITLKKANNSDVEGNISFNSTNTAIFSSKKKLALLSDYVLTVDSTVSDLVGNTLESEEKFNFTTRDGEWKDAALIEINNAGDAGSPQIAVDSLGNAIAVWRQFNGTRYSIWANKFTRNSGWNVAEEIDKKDRGNADNPQIAFDVSGNAIAIWEQESDTSTRTNIWANRFTPNSGWNAAESVEGNDVGGSKNPQIAFNTLGNAIAIWQSSDGSTSRIVVKRFTPKDGWSDEAGLTNSSARDATNPQIVLDTLGNAIAIWKEFDGTRSNIQVNRFTPRSGWIGAESIENGDGTASSPQISMDSAGNAIAIWKQSRRFNASRPDIRVNQFTPSRGWNGVVQLENNVGGGNSPQISMDGAGNAIAIWTQSDNIWVNQFTPGIGWSGTEKIGNDDREDVFNPQIAFDTSGNAIAVWQQSSDNSSFSIVSNRLIPRRGWSGVEKIESDDTGGAVTPQIALDALGNAITVWTQFDGTRANILVNHFE